MVSVAIVEDDLLFQEELAKLLVSIPEIDLAGTFTTEKSFYPSSRNTVRKSSS